MKKCIIYGNCQADALKLYLKRSLLFEQDYEIVSLPPIHLLNDSHISYLTTQIKSVKLFIHQPISDDYKGIKELGTNYLKALTSNDCIKLSFPSMYFKGYNPELINLNLKPSDLSNKFAPYFDKYILKYILKGFSTGKIIEIITRQNEVYKSIRNSFTKSLKELQLRESNLDLIISDIILDYGHKEKLFHVFNHPSNRVLTIIANKILEKLFHGNFYMSLGPDVLANTSFPIHHSVYCEQQFSFENKFSYKIKNSFYPIDQYIEMNRRLIDNDLITDMAPIWD